MRCCQVFKRWMKWFFRHLKIRSNFRNNYLYLRGVSFNNLKHTIFPIETHLLWRLTPIRIDHILFALQLIKSSRVARIPEKMIKYLITIIKRRKYSNFSHMAVNVKSINIVLSLLILLIKISQQKLRLRF